VEVVVARINMGLPETDSSVVGTSVGAWVGAGVADAQALSASANIISRLNNKTVRDFIRFS